MSSVQRKRPFGENKNWQQPTKFVGEISFLVLASGDTIADFIEFVEYVYETTARVEYGDLVKIQFQSGYNRTAAGVRFAAKLYAVRLFLVREWM